MGLGAGSVSESFSQWTKLLWSRIEGSIFESLAMTEKLYLEDMYARKAEATVTQIDGTFLLLDRTLFFAEGGGQVGDTGTIDGIRVVDTQKKIGPKSKLLTHPDFPAITVNTDTVHILEAVDGGLKVGDKVNLQIDWDRRYAIMRIHSATHVVLLCVHRILGELPVKGCLLQPDKGRIDFSGKIPSSRMEEIEEACNRFIAKSLEIKNVSLEGEKEALYWRCDDHSIPCGGTHVRNTKEIGPICLKRRSQGKNLDRIYIELTG